MDFLKHNRSCLKSDSNNKHFTWEPTRILREEVAGWEALGYLDYIITMVTTANWGIPSHAYNYDVTGVTHKGERNNSGEGLRSVNANTVTFPKLFPSSHQDRI